jgi:hypothetical protein
MFLKMKVTGLTIDPFTNAPIVILKDTDDDTVALPIWIGPMEASSIAAELEKMDFVRPMTHDLIKNIFQKTGSSVKRIEISDLKDNVYYATIYIESNGEAIAIDSRPSDAIAIALRVNTPIFVNPIVLDKSKRLEPMSNLISRGDEDKSWLDILEDLSSDAFGKYKM